MFDNFLKEKVKINIKKEDYRGQSETVRSIDTLANVSNIKIKKRNKDNEETEIFGLAFIVRYVDLGTKNIEIEYENNTYLIKRLRENNDMFGNKLYLSLETV